MTPTDLRQNFLPVKSVGLHYTHFRNHLPLFMRLPGPKKPKTCHILRGGAKLGLGAVSAISATRRTRSDTDKAGCFANPLPTATLWRIRHKHSHREPNGP